MEDVGISFLDQLTDEIVVDCDWTLVASDWVFGLIVFLSSLSNKCLTLSWEFEELTIECTGLNFDNSFETVFQEGISSLAEICDVWAKW